TITRDAETSNAVPLLRMRSSQSFGHRRSHVGPMELFYRRDRSVTATDANSATAATQTERRRSGAVFRVHGIQEVDGSIPFSSTNILIFTSRRRYWSS